jgi:hypothetical protein
MQLEKFVYRENAATPQEWALEEARFGQVNLIVGRNASGKSRLINTINGLAALVSGQKKLVYLSGDYDVTFKESNRVYRYVLQYQNQSIVKEMLKIDNDVVLDRQNSGEGVILFEELKTRGKFQTPPNELAVGARRDALQHPFLEPLHKWGQSVRYYQFGTDLGQTWLSILPPGTERQTPSDAPPMPSTDPKMVVALFKTGLTLGPHFKKRILADFERVGYNCSDIGLMPFVDVNIQGTIPDVIYVHEADLPGPTRSREMSTGMFRALSLIIQVNYSIMTDQATCFLIDDIGEGLDFERSKLLIGLLIHKASRNKLQLFMTSNDRFVMNDVPLRYWHILDRQGGKVRIFNNSNSRKTFQRFQSLGLNNFDLFARKAYL